MKYRKNYPATFRRPVFYYKIVCFRIAGGVFGGMFWFCCASAFWVLPHNDFPGLLHNVAFRGLLLTGLSAGKQTLSEDIGRVKKFYRKKSAPAERERPKNVFFVAAYDYL